MTLRNPLSNSEIVQRFQQPDREIIGGLVHRNLVVRLSDDLVVKCGHGVLIEEVENQRTAFELLDSSIVRVPRVVHFFTQTDGGYTGYLVMEYIKGEISNSVTSKQIDQIVKILAHFSTIQCQRPGPLLQPGTSRGMLWEGNGKPTFQTVEEMEQWLNFRIKGVGPKLALGKYPLVLCHLDLTLRNIIWLKDNSVCLLD